MIHTFIRNEALPKIKDMVPEADPTYAYPADASNPVVQVAEVSISHGAQSQAQTPRHKVQLGLLSSILSSHAGSERLVNGEEQACQIAGARRKQPPRDVIFPVTTHPHAARM